jgi:Domain of unknown function (DUF5801)/RTX calcium-binding nonapeptide repeat (4 copies)/Cadherin-like domain
MATAATGNAGVGTIKIVTGDVKIIGVDGVARQAQVGDRVFARESIQTGANAIVQVQLENGRMLDLGRESKIALDNDILGPQGPAATTAPATGDVASIQAQIAAGADPSKVAEATAAGGAPGAGGADGSGGSPVVIDQANSQGPVTSGFNTAPAGIAFDTAQDPQFINRPPVVISLRGVVSVTEEGLEGGNPDGDGARDRNNPDEPIVYTGKMDISDPDGNPLDVDFGIPAATLFSHGDQVIWELSNDNNTLIGYVMRDVDSGPAVRVNVLEATIDNEGNFEITLLEPIDHPLAGVEDDLDILDLQIPVTATDPFGASGSGVLELFIEDDSPIIADGIEGGPTLPTDNQETFALLSDNARYYGGPTIPTVSADEDDLKYGNHDYARGDDYPRQWTTLPVRFGADGPADEDALVLSDDGIVDQNGNPLTSDGIELQYEWNEDNRTLTGYIVRDGEYDIESDGDSDSDYDGRQDIFVIQVGSTSHDFVQISIQLLGPLDHPLGTGADGIEGNWNTPEDNLIFNISYIAKDFDGDTAEGRFAVNIDDDSPTICVTANDSYSNPVVLVTQDAETRGNYNNDCAESNCNFSGVFREHHRFGADGPGDVTWDYRLELMQQSNTSHSHSHSSHSHSDGEGNRLDSGLKSDGDTVYLTQLDDGTVVGYTGSHAPDEADDYNVVFSLSVDDHGVVKLVQRQEIDHDKPGEYGPVYDDQLEFLANGLVKLVGTATVTDNDGDSASETAWIDLGGNVAFADDGPEISTEACNENSVVLVTQDDDAVRRPYDNSYDYDESHARFDGIFKVSGYDYGADGPGKIEWEFCLSVTDEGMDSGLNHHGQNIYLFEENGKIVGRAQGAGQSEGDDRIIFTISVDDSGEVTLRQYEQIDHNPETPSGSPFEDQLAVLESGLVELKGTATITDGDGDKAKSSQTIDLGGNIKFADDGPTLSLSLEHNVKIVIDETDNERASGETDVVGGSLGKITVSGSTLLDEDADYGADGQASSGAKTFSLTFTNGADSGFDDSQTNQNVVLVRTGANSVEGRVGNSSGALAFTISVGIDGSVTVEQFRAVEHSNTNNHDELSGGMTSNVLKLTEVIKDFDGDTAEKSVDLGSIIKFEDDGPKANDFNAGTVTEGSAAVNLGNAMSVLGISGGADGLAGISAFTGGQGTLTINGSGNLIYTPPASVNNSSGDVTTTFSYTVTDGDGDTVTKQVTVKIADGANPTAGGPITLALDDQNLADGSTPGNPDFMSNTITFTQGSDAISSIKFSSSTASLTGGLSWTRVSDTQIVGKDGSVTVVTLDLTVSGTVATVKATLNDNYDSHPALGDDLKNLGSVGVVATDSDGDPATGTVNVTVSDDVPVFNLVNDGNDSGTAVSISTLNPASTTTYTQQFADWKYNADGSGGSPTLSGVTGNVTVNSSSANSVVLDLKDASNTVVGRLTLNADGTDSLQVFNRIGQVSDVLLTSDVSGGNSPALTKTINSSISGLVVTITGSDGDGNTTENDDRVNPSNVGWAVDDQQIDEGESLTFSFNNAVQGFSFTADGFTGNPSNGDVGITVRVYYNAAKTSYEDFNVNVASGGTVQVANFPGLDNPSFYGVRVLSDTSAQDGNDGFRLNNVTVSQNSAAPDLDFAFTLNIKDGDNDTATQTFNVHLDGDAGTGLTVEAIAGTSGADTLVGTSGNNVLIGGEGNDILTGNAGNDTFKFTGTQSLGNKDTITDFTIGNPASNANADVLNLQDVLGGVPAAVTAINGDVVANANDFITFTFAGSGASQTATMFVDTSGAGGAPGTGAPVATFTVGAGSFTSDGLLTTLLTNNQIVV